MRPPFRLVGAAAGTVLLIISVAAQAQSDRPASTTTGHALVKPSDLQWVNAPPALPPGAKVAVLQGDPNAAGAFTIRLEVPAGYKIPLHTHPTDEVITVISGNVDFKMGSATAVAETASPGAFLIMPSGMQHAASASSDSILQVTSQGPFVINYVNPADDPRQRK